MGLIDSILLIIFTIGISIVYIEYQKRKIIVDAYKEKNSDVQYDQKFEKIYNEMINIINVKEFKYFQSNIKKSIFTFDIILSTLVILLFIVSNFSIVMNVVLVYTLVFFIVALLISIYALYRVYVKNEKEYEDKYKGIICYEYEKILNAKLSDNSKQIENLKNAYKNSGFDEKMNDIVIDDYIQTNIEGKLAIFANMKIYKKNNYMYFKFKDNSIETSNGLFICAASRKNKDLYIKGSLELFNYKKDKIALSTDTQIDKDFKEFYSNLSNKPTAVSENIENILLELYNRFAILLTIKVSGDLVYIKINNKELLSPNILSESLTKEQLWSRYEIMKLLENLIYEL